MPLGNPSSATANPNNHVHYLIQRSVFAIDYDDQNGEPNWVSWDLTADDIGPAKRTPTFHPDADLPAGFHHTKSADYKQSGFDRGHMCPSADRTDNATDNGMVFAMSNIIPQAPDNNQGVWEHLESDCRGMAQEGNELLITCGPEGFSGEHLHSEDPVMVPSHTWKIVVVVPNGPGSVLSRITCATRVIAVNIPNTAGVRRYPWSKYLVSVAQLELATGLKFFTALAPDLASCLKSKTDGQPMPTVATAVQTQSQMAAPTTSPHPTNPSSGVSWIMVAFCLLVLILILIIVVMVLFFRMRSKQ